MNAIQHYLPEHEGILPKWLLFVSLVSVLNSAQAYSTLKFTRRVYPGPAGPSATPSSSSSPATPLFGRMFGTWTFLASIIRLYAAYHISNPQIYQLALWSYVVAWAHFTSEWLVFRSTRLGAGLAGPLVVANLSLFWMWNQWGFYVQS